MILSRFNQIAAIIALLMIIAATALSIQWMADHPESAGYDETAYLNLLEVDARYLGAFDSISALVNRYVLVDRERPPAHRVLAAPVLAVTVFSPNAARVTALFWYLVALLFIGAAAHKLGGLFASALTVTAIVLSPMITPPAIRFGTEFPLMLAMGMTLFAFAHIWRDATVKPWVWVLLAIGLGGGLLAKLSFGPIMLLPLAATVFGVVRYRERGQLRPLLLTGLAGALLAATWYAPNIAKALEYAAKASDFGGRHAIGSPSDYPAMFVKVILGEPLALWVITGLALSIIFAKQAQRGAPDRRAYIMAWVLIASPLLMLALYFKGNNQNPRFMGPPMVSAFMGLGLMAAWALDELTSKRPARRVVALLGMGTLATAQLLWVMFPHGYARVHDPQTFTQHYYGNAFQTYAQFNWSALADHPSLSWADTQQHVALIGGGSSFNKQLIKRGWADRPGATKIDLIFSGYNQDGFDGPNILDQAATYDAVLISPNYLGTAVNKDELANQFNAELIVMFDEDPRFESSTTVTLQDANDIEPAFNCLVYRVSVSAENEK